MGLKKQGLSKGWGTEQGDEKRAQPAGWKPKSLPKAGNWAGKKSSAEKKGTSRT